MFDARVTVARAAAKLFLHVFNSDNMSLFGMPAILQRSQLWFQKETSLCVCHD